MSRSGWTPSIVPNGVDQNSYLVEDCLGRNGCVWREADSEQTNLETVITDLMSGQYGDSQRVIAFNTAEGWSEDVSEDVAREIQRRSDLASEDPSSTLDRTMPTPIRSITSRRDRMQTDRSRSSSAVARRKPRTAFRSWRAGTIPWDYTDLARKSSTQLGNSRTPSRRT